MGHLNFKDLKKLRKWMIKKLKNKLEVQENKRLFDNFISLTTLQVFNYLLPLITLPYLVRVLGADYFGLLAFATATVAYFGVLADYGFNLTATKEISVNRDDQSKLQEIFSSVMIIKTMLMVLGFLLLSLLLYSFEKFSQDALIYYYSFGVVLGQVLFPIWLFQGMEQMRYITYLNILSKLIFAVAIFGFVQEKTDYYLVPVFTSLGFIIAGIGAQIMVYKQFGLKFSWQKFSTIKYYLSDGWHVFISNIAISLYTVSTTFILGLFTNNTIVGYYAAADQINAALSKLRSPLLDAFYPFVSKRVNDSKSDGMKIIQALTKYVFIIYVVLCLSVFLLAEPIVMLVLGDEYFESIIILQLIVWLPLLSTLSSIFGIQTMLPFGYKKEFSSILIKGSVLNLFLALILVYNYAHIGSAVTLLIVESYITISMFIFLNQKGLKVVKL
jgi:PST family polysaccharide transporter